jgi:hypothetical protein
MRRICVCLSLFVLFGCGQRSQDDEKHLNAAAFSDLMDRLADGWSQQKTDEALACFTEDATYMEPPDIQFYKGAFPVASVFCRAQTGNVHAVSQLVVR